jgi:hypothetical protein
MSSLACRSTLSAACKYRVKERIYTNLDCAYLLKYIMFVIIAVENKPRNDMRACRYSSTHFYAWY